MHLSAGFQRRKNGKPFEIKSFSLFPRERQRVSFHFDFLLLFGAFPKPAEVVWVNPVRLVTFKLDDRIFCEPRLIGLFGVTLGQSQCFRQKVAAISTN